MANWNNPLLTSNYSDFLSDLKDRDLDVAKQFDGVTVSNPVSGMKRWNNTNKYWEQYNGSAWVELATKYSIDVESVDGCTVNDSSSASTTVLWTSDKISNFADNFYTKAQIDTIRNDYVVKNGENGTLTLGTNDASAINLETNNTARLSIGSSGNVSITAPSSGVALAVTPLSGQDAISTTGQVTASTLKSTVATGTAPFTVTSTTKVANLNADYLDGYSATNANTANTIVQRDASGNFSAGTITATLSGSASQLGTSTVGSSTLPMYLNAGTATACSTTLGVSITGNSATATTLATARTINGVSFNGSANITAEPYVERDDSTNASRYIAFVDSSTAGYQRLNMDTNLYYNPSTNYLYTNVSGALSGNATTATTLATSRTINGVSFNGSANITIYDSTKAPLASPAFTGTPTAPTASPGTNTTQLATTAFVKANSIGIGIGQTWQNVTASRSSGVTYTNTTGKPIGVVAMLHTNNSNSGSFSVYVAGVQLYYFPWGGSYWGNISPFVIVPDGATYSVSITGGGLMSYWYELR